MNRTTWRLGRNVAVAAAVGGLLAPLVFVIADCIPACVTDEDPEAPWLDDLFLVSYLPFGVLGLVAVVAAVWSHRKARQVPDAPSSARFLAAPARLSGSALVLGALSIAASVLSWSVSGTWLIFVALALAVVAGLAGLFSACWPGPWTRPKWIGVGALVLVAIAVGFVMASFVWAELREL